MTVGSAVDTEYGRPELVIADSAGRILRLESRGVYGDGKYDADGVFNSGYPSEESSDYKTGAIESAVTGTTTSTNTNQLIDSAASFPTWVVGCIVYNTTDNTYALISGRTDAQTLDLVDQGDTADIFPDVGDSYSILGASAVVLSGTVYSYIVDASSAWTPEYGKGTAFNYLGLRGLWCAVQRLTDGTIERKQILSNESDKLWFAGAWTMNPVAGDYYYVAPIYFEMQTGYIYPGQGHSLSLNAMRSRVVSSNGSPYWFELYGSGRDQTKESSVQRRRSVSKLMRNHPFVRFSTHRDMFAQAKIKGILQDDQIVFRNLEMIFNEHER